MKLLTRRLFILPFAAILLTSGGLGSVSLASQEQKTKVYSFGFVPQQSAAVLVKKWGPILRFLSEKTGYMLRFQTAPKIPDFEKRMTEGAYDFSYMNPLHFTFFHADPGYQAFARQKGKRIKGIIVVRRDSPLLAVKKKDGELAALKELSDQTLSFPAPAAFAASVLPRGYLGQKDIAFTPKYVGSHDSVYRGVASGRFTAGGGIQRTFGTVAEDIREQLTVLYTTEGYTPHAFAAHSRVPDEVRTAVQNAFVDMFNDPQGRKLLENVGFKKGIEKAYDKDWDDVRGLGFKELPG